MADVGKVEGPSGSPDNLGKKDKGSVDDEKFRQQMRKKVTEVSSIDPDEKKKRKQRGEEDDEEDVAGTSANSNQSVEQATPFDLEKESKKTGMIESAPRSRPRMGAEPSKQPSQVTSSMSTPSKEGTEEGQKMGQTPQEKSSSENTGVPSNGMKSEKNLTTSKQQQAASSPLMTPPDVKERPKSAAYEKFIDKRGIQASELEETHSEQEPDRSSLLKKAAEEKQIPVTHKEENEEVAADQGVNPLPSEVFASPQAEEDGEKKIREKTANPQINQEESPLPLNAQISARPVISPEIIPSYATLPPQVQALFDRMVGVITVMRQAGMTETTFTLNAPQFASSAFFGAQITIQEFSTAPHAFNIQLSGNTQAVALFQGNMQNLMASFQAGGYNFRINRIETAYLAEKPFFKRKERTENEDEEGERQE